LKGKKSINIDIIDILFENIDTKNSPIFPSLLGEILDIRKRFM